MGKLNINLDNYESRLERLSKLVDKMSSLDWTVENAIQFCKEQGMQDKGVNIPQSINLNTVEYLERKMSFIRRENERFIIR